jgi:hypothetical protein
MSENDVASAAEGPATLAEALVAAQHEMPAVDRDGTNPHFKSSFTTLDNLLSKVRPVLNRNGLVLVQAPDMEDGREVLRTIIMHRSGEQMSFAAALSPTKEGPQGQGAAITYMRRYAAAAALAIADQEDDDGNRTATSEGAQPSAPLDDDEAQALSAQARDLRDQIRGVDEGALPAQSFDNALAQRGHSHDRLRDFVANLTELLADVQRFDDLKSDLSSVLDESEWKKVVAKAERRASRRERADVLQAALDEAKAKGGDSDGK